MQPIVECFSLSYLAFLDFSLLKPYKPNRLILFQKPQPHIRVVHNLLMSLEHRVKVIIQKVHFLKTTLAAIL